MEMETGGIETVTEKSNVDLTPLQLDAALQGLQETCERYIGAGKKVLIQ